MATRGRLRTTFPTNVPIFALKPDLLVVLDWAKLAQLPPSFGWHRTSSLFDVYDNHPFDFFTLLRVRCELCPVQCLLHP